MAMTKAEKAKLEAAALRWPMFEEPLPITREQARELPAVPIPTGYGTSIHPVVVAYFFNAYTGQVSKGWLQQSGGSHCRHDPDLLGTGSKARDWNAGYRTYQDAYRALRWAVCREVAKKLHLLDERAETETLSF